jgi:hypothetical protein
MNATLPLPAAPTAAPAPAPDPAPNSSTTRIAIEYRDDLPLHVVLPDPANRKDRDKEELKRLADSIQAEGLLQPIVVRPLPTVTGAYASDGASGWHVWPPIEGTVAPGRKPLHGPCSKREAEAVAALYRAGQGYRIIAGERRWEAHRLLDLTRIRAFVHRGETEISAAAKQVIENLGRKDLNPIEEAHQMKRLADLGMTQKAIEVRMTQKQYSRMLPKMSAAKTIVTGR